MTDPSNPEGLSKNQLKKLQKQAEKKAKKAAAKGGGDAAPAEATPAGGGNAKAAAPAKAAAAPRVKAAPVWKIGGPKADNASTIKVAFASQLFGASITSTSKGTASKIAAGDFFASSEDHPVLMFGDTVVGGGGNAMAKAVRHASKSTPPCVPAIDLLVDEWLEWERNTLRSAKNEKQCSAALAHLETALTNKVGPSVHLIGIADTVADVVVTVALEELLAKYPQVEVPDLVATYRKSHEPQLAKAKALAKEWQDSSSKLVPLNLDHPVLSTVLKAVFQQAALPIAGGDETLLPDAMVTKCANAKHGDYQCMAAMPMFAALKKSGSLPATMKSPQDVAKAIIENIGTDHPVVEELKIQGPGFVLCQIKASYLQTHVHKWIHTGKLPKPTTDEPYECVVDFSSPNIAKEMHVGHLRSTILGESVCRILEYVGHHVHRTNHVGDWGTQFGMLIQYLKEEYPEVAASEEATMPNITDLTVFYKAAKQRFDESPEFKKISQTNVVKLQSGDAECRKIWKMLCDVSRNEFQKVYNRLDATIEEKGESFYNDKISPVIEEFDKDGKLTTEEGGAKCVWVEGFQIPLMLQKSDGGFGYDSTDMAALKYRLFEVGAQRIVVLTDYGQGQHFDMCFGAAKAIGWLDEKNQRLDHIGFGTVNGEDGKRFKTRSGDTVRLVDLLDEAVNRMEESLRARIKEGKASIAEEDVHEVAEAIGYGAVKYFDMSRNPTSEYKFSYDKMLETTGNTAVYLLYARARLESIIAKAKAEHNCDIEELIKAKEAPTVEHPSERKLVMQLHQWTEVMEQTLDDLYPCHICDYVYNVAIAASDFVTKCKVLGTPEMKSRLLLCHATIVAMVQCFDLLGIRQVKRI